MFKRSSEHQFSLAYFNLGYLKEKLNQKKESIEYYKKASDEEDSQLIFHNLPHYDKRLEISKTFIICYTNLKLSEYYFTSTEYDESRKYFNRAFNKLSKDKERSSFQFEINITNENHKYIFSYLQYFILNFPLFNLMNQPNLSLETKMRLKAKNNMNYTKDIKSNIKIELIKEENIKPESHKDIIFCNNINKEKDEMYEYQIKSTKRNEELVFNNSNELFDFILENDAVKRNFVTGIQRIIELMREIIYTPPYFILFGRINIERPKENNDKKKNISELFYEGLSIDELKP